ncbi:CCR4-Not complex component, Not1-domain-containing protein [Mucor mucedo]|uniref:CCR4-Not complex component, Not1-domain-containing protein n=1 Tax=Mucor mucedo TaxID=29922 RepID=UPI0022201E12|nr:CCR4-Not complex component, Not1-domain-containing protein [Mucor mucedo]KAI7893233.1 CCR4-Not complex component, Not1-domain-containing protein [Mucor mucedo]
MGQHILFALDAKKNGSLDALKKKIMDMYATNPTCAPQVIDLVKELDALPSLLDALPPFLALDLASCAAQQNLLHLEPWLYRKIQSDNFISPCLDYVAQKNVSKDPSVLETITIFLKVLSSRPLPPTYAEMLSRLQSQCHSTYPNLFVPDASTEVSFSQDVEKEANVYYERIYNGELSMDAMINLLKEKSQSENPRDRQVFACMIHNLFDEYSFFPKYPDKELTMTSVLFGSLIQHGLVTDASLSTALGYVSDALRNPVGSKMFNFGIGALLQFKSRLHEWPQYCQHLQQIPHLVQARPDLLLPMMDNASDASTTTPAAPSFSCVHVPKVKTEIAYHEPTDAVQDKILFIINNVAENNMTSKVTELSKILDPALFQWFSHYLIVKRISLEPNNHELYVHLLDAMQNKVLVSHVLAETFSNILILLNSEKTISNSSERSLLKNLGSWLGRLTLAKNKPILHKSIAFRDLLLEAYDTQRLIVAIPFTCKVLEQCADSRVFRPPNPWLMSILKLLVELYESADLKLNLKFEIEVLCKTLHIELKDIQPTSALKNRKPQEQPMTFNRYPAAPALPPLHPELGTIMTEIPIPNLAPYIAFNPQISLYSTQPAAKRLVLQAFTESIREIIGPVVERAVAIAVVSTRDLVSKDFVMEMDETKMRKAAHMMSQNLAASLAMVTSKEPLRLSIVANLRTIFLAHGLNDSSAEQAIILTVADNLDLMCAVIEKAAMGKVTLEIDQALSTAFAVRKKHREQRPHQPFVDVDTYQKSGFPSTLPPHLCPQPTGVSPTQLSVYEDFMRIPRSTPIPQDNKPASAHAILERFAQCISELEKAVAANQIWDFHALPPQSPIRELVRQITMLAVTSFDKCEAAKAFAQKVVQLLYKTEQPLLIEVYVVLLENLCEVSASVGSLVTSWLTHADDERKYNVPVTVALIKAGLIDLPEQDRELSMLIESGRASAIDFTLKLIRACLLDETPPLATRQEFKASMECLSHLRQEPSINLLLEEIRKRQPEDAGLREQLGFFFGEWVRLYSHPGTTEKTMLAFATQLSQQSIFCQEEMSSLFYRVCIEVSVEHAIKYKMVPGAQSTAYQPMDAFSKLLVTLLQVPEAEPMTTFTRALSVIVLVISHHHQVRGQHFDQRPFLRLFTSLLTDLHLQEANVQYLALLTGLSNTLFTLQPSHFPGLTFAWLQLISHRLFMPQLLLAENQVGWSAFQRLLVCLFQFLAPYLRHVELSDTMRMLYRGTLRVLLVLLHDFPEFLCDYHYSFCDVIPSTCIQLRNLILSAFPRSMRLPDPFTPNLKIDLLPEIQQSPRILSDFMAALDESLQSELDVYLETNKLPTTAFLEDLKGMLKLKEGGYNVELLNAVIFYTGTTAISKAIPVQQGPTMTIYQYLLSECDSEGRYLFLSAIANQLRYPNSHTHYFSCVLLYLFGEIQKEIVKEQITRVLLERLIVNRPHPWGLLITFIELIKNPRYSFWTHSFTRCATDIERLFESVAR